MHVSALLLVLAAAPAPAPTPQLASLSGLNIVTLKPWLLANLPALAACALPSAMDGSDEVSVQAQFSKSPDVTVLKVEAQLSDVACVRGVVERWKRDGKQPSAGPFAFTYRFKPSAAQRDAVKAEATAAFKALCAELGAGPLTAERVGKAMERARPVLPMGAWMSVADAVAEAEPLDAGKQGKELLKALRDTGRHLKAEVPCAK